MSLSEMFSLFKSSIFFNKLSMLFLDFITSNSLFLYSNTLLFSNIF